MNFKRALLFVTILLIIVSVSASYYRYVVLHDYLITVAVDCDPDAESCFVWQCDPSIEGDCTGEADEDIWFYSLVEGTTKYMCDNREEDCDPSACVDDPNADCEMIYCSEETIADYAPDDTCAYEL